MDDTVLKSYHVVLFCFPEHIVIVAGMQQDWVTELKAVGPDHCLSVPQLGDQTLPLKNYCGTTAGDSFYTIINV